MNAIAEAIGGDSMGSSGPGTGAGRAPGGARPPRLGPSLSTEGTTQLERRKVTEENEEEIRN
jgi:hypothetical protein